MKDPRHYALAQQLVDYSTDVQKGETVYIEIKGTEALEAGKQVIKRVAERGATPFWFYNDESILRQWLMLAEDDHMKQQAAMHLELMKRADAYIGIRGSNNVFDLADIPAETRDRYNALFYKPVHFDERVSNTRWVVLRYPNNAMAQLAETSQEAFEDFYYEVCCANYHAMSKAQTKLQSLMEATNDIHIIGPGTDLRFSIKDIPVVKCDGHRNIPDGECFTAPVRDSIQGTIAYNTPSLYQGVVYNGISFTFKDGKIVEAHCDGRTDELNGILDTDEGARYTGEFAIGVNPFIRHPMKDTLFDEKIAGSFHLTPGQSYDTASNGNDSSIHWDLVMIQREDYGGGEIYFDGKLIRKDGIFVDEDLEKAFSAEALKSTLL